MLNNGKDIQSVKSAWSILHSEIIIPIIITIIIIIIIIKNAKGVIIIIIIIKNEKRTHKLTLDL